MQAFISYLLQFGSLSQQQIDFVSERGTSVQLSRNDYFWEAGKMVRQIGILMKGVIRIYYYNNKAEEITRYFIDEDHLILSGDDIDENYIPSVYLEAITDCELVVFSKKDWKEIGDTIIGWENIIQKITARTHREKIERRSELISQDATARYLDFIEKFPSLLNRVPLAYIASYLGITQSSLSRIRKSIR